MFFMEITFWVFQVLAPALLKTAPSNILSMVVTFDVLRYNPSFQEEFLNMNDMSVISVPKFIPGMLNFES